MRPLLLVDYSSLLYRAFHSLPGLVPMQGVYGFLNMLARLVDGSPADGLAIAVDDDWRPAFRVDALPSYKTHRVASRRGRRGSGGAAGGRRPRGAARRSASRSSAPTASRPRT